MTDNGNESGNVGKTQGHESIDQNEIGNGNINTNNINNGEEGQEEREGNEENKKEPFFY